jgi:RNA polymerase sigma factor (sigma-70 family)
MSPRISISLLASQSDQRLAALAGEGHERAFEALVQRYRRPLLRYCRRMRLGDARAEDVLQQAFLQAWLAFARGSEVRDVRPWLYRIVHNAAVNAMRANAEGHSELTESVQAGAALAGESNVQRTMAVRDALTDVAALPQMQQQAIFLTAVDGQSHDEVADVLGISEGALRGLLYRARTTLRSAAAALMPPPLLAWAAGGPGAAAPSAERLAELSTGGGALGVGGLLLKGAVVAVTAGAVASGATVASSDSPRADATHRPPATRPTGATADQGAAGLAPDVNRQLERGRAGVARGRSQQTGRRGGGAQERRGNPRSPDDRSGRSSPGGGSREGRPSGGASSGDDLAGNGRGGSSTDSGSGGGQPSSDDSHADATTRSASGNDGAGSASGSSDRGGGEAQPAPGPTPEANLATLAGPIPTPATSGAGDDSASAVTSGSGSSGSSPDG